MADTRKINLLPNKGQTLFSQFLSWSLTIGRLLVIITESLALSVFIYRFSLDMKIVDYHDQIKQGSAIVNAFGEQETKFRNLQSRLSYIKQYNAVGNKPLLVLNDIVGMGRDKVTFKSILVSTKDIQIEAQAQSPSALAAFVQKLQNYPTITSLTIDRVENKTANALITITVAGSIKQ